jgi:DNA-binding MarR family transcriptional regulator
MVSKRREQLMEKISLEVRRSQSRTDAYDEAVATALGLNRTDFRCLDILSTEGTLTAGRLAELMGLTSGAMTSVLDRLEAAGYARRIRDTDDRRRVHVELTPKMHESAGPYYQPLFEMSAKLYARYSDEQLELLLDFLETAAELFEGEFARLREQLSQEAPTE